MHSALVWASCNSDSATEGLRQLVKPAVRPNELPEFFWGHLERDLKLVGVALGKNMEEAAIIVHLVIRHILTSDLTGSETIICIHVLTSILFLPPSLPTFLLLPPSLPAHGLQVALRSH